MAITERKVLIEGEKFVESFHSFRVADYVSVVAIYVIGLIPLVHHYRAALDGWRVELPGGYLKPGSHLRLAQEESCMKRLGGFPRVK